MSSQRLTITQLRTSDFVRDCTRDPHTAYLGDLRERATVAALAAATAVLVGCAAAPPREAVAPPELVTAPPDKAVFYFFRPALDRTGVSSAPQLLVNGQPIGRMGWSTYTYAELTPGEHDAELRPLEGDEKQWSAQGRICALAGKVYYAAIWNQAQAAGRETVMPLVLRSGGIIPIFIGPERQKGGVTFEMVEPAMAQETLHGLRKVPPQPLAPLQAKSMACRNAP